MVFIGSRLPSLSLSALLSCYLRQESYEVVPQVRICAGFVPACHNTGARLHDNPVGPGLRPA